MHDLVNNTSGTMTEVHRLPVYLPEGIGTVDWTDTVVVINGGEDDEETVMEGNTYTEIVVSLRP